MGYYGRYGHEECSECRHYQADLRRAESEKSDLERRLRDMEWDHQHELDNLRYDHQREIARLRSEYQDAVMMADLDVSYATDELREEAEKHKRAAMIWAQALRQQIEACEFYVQYGTVPTTLDLARAELPALRAALGMLEEAWPEIERSIQSLYEGMAALATEWHAASPLAEALRLKLSPGEYSEAHGDDFKLD